MHFALPPRKSSSAPLYMPRSSRSPMFRRSRIQFLFFCALGIGSLLFLFSRIPGHDESAPAGTPPVVIVTVLEPTQYSKKYLDNIKENRNEYAKRHGYTTFMPTVTDYALNDSPNSWAKLPAMRHALAKYPHTKYFWFLEQNALIMDPDLKIEQIMDPKKLDTLMLRDQPVVPPDSVIRTFSHLHGDQIHFVISQDKDGLVPASFIVSNGDWTKFFLDTWFDPLYRSYNFQKADTHALEHIVQWHPTILSKMAIIPQRTLNAYAKSVEDLSKYRDGDFVVHFASCATAGPKNCELEAEPFSKQWQTIFNARR